MNDRLIAIRKTAGQMALFLLAIVALTYLTSFISVQTFAFIFLAIAIFGVGYILYSINIDNIQSQKRFEESENRIREIRQRGL